MRHLIKTFFSLLLLSSKQFYAPRISPRRICSGSLTPLPKSVLRGLASATALTRASPPSIPSGTSTLTCKPAREPSCFDHQGYDVSNLGVHFTFCPVSRYIGKMDAITISVWNHRKIHKKEGGGFLGCVRIMSNAIQRLKDTGCNSDQSATCPFIYSIGPVLAIGAVQTKTITQKLSSWNNRKP